MKRFALLSSLLALAAMTMSDGAAADYEITSLAAEQSTSQAGAHPDFTLTFELARLPNGEPEARTKEITIDLPPGLVGNPTSFPACSALQLTTINLETGEGGCPQDAQVGVTDILLFGEGGPAGFMEPIYSMEAPGGDVVARLGFMAFVYPVFVDVRVRSESDYGLSAKLTGLSSLVPVLAARNTLWGVPAAKSHDSQRLTPFEAVDCGAPCTATGTRPSSLARTPFMVNPTQCGVPRLVHLTATSYLNPDRALSRSTSLPAITGCRQLKFNPSLQAAPTTRATSSPSGLDVLVKIPQDESPDSLATSQLRNATVTLPRGMTISPGAADGLQACSAKEIGFGTTAPPACPDGSKIGTAEFDVPALSRRIDGAVYQRSPEPGNLFRVWLAADELGAQVKIPGELRADPVTGQLTSLFVDNPQVPLRELELHVFGGDRAPLATPAACGSYLTHFEFVPWSGTAAVTGDSPMEITDNCNTNGFSPRLSTGPASPAAGVFSPLLFELARQAHEQNIGSFSLTLPPGQTAKLAGVPLCGGLAASQGNCPSASRVGTANVAAGPGPAPLWLPQPGRQRIEIYLAGPYKGAPYSLVVRAPAQAGPFDLGTVVLRLAVDIDPRTAQVLIKSDPLPQMLEGVPVTYRSIRSSVNRPEFALNPTSCDPEQTVGTAFSSQGAVAPLTSRYQIGGCARLGFKPRFTARLSGPTKRGRYPALRTVLKTRKKDANLAKVVVALPRTEFLAQEHIRTVCTRPQFAANQCPPGSAYGRARAVTPLLDDPLEGTVYLRSSSNPLPDLVIALRGKVDIDLVGRIDSVNGGIRATFSSIPDVPATKVVISMKGGAKGLLVNSRNLCRARSRLDINVDGQNGKTADQRPLLKNGCSPKSKARKHRRQGDRGSKGS
jgi:hypothetical protein